MNMSYKEEDEWRETGKKGLHGIVRNIFTIGGILLVISLIMYLIYWFFHDCIGLEMDGFGEVVLFFFVLFLVVLYRIFK